jgi:hypothetical protein
MIMTHLEQLHQASDAQKDAANAPLWQHGALMDLLLNPCPTCHERPREPERASGEEQRRSMRLAHK